MRASVLVLGPLLAKYGDAEVSLPGGCAIGSRPVDLHIKGLQALGADISVDHGFIKASAKRLRGARHVFDMVSVGATENVLMAATLAEGTSVLENAAMEPEIVDLAECLKAMGAKIEGAGTGRIVVRASNACTAASMPWWPIASKPARSPGRRRHDRRPRDRTQDRPDTLDAVLDKLTEAGAEITVDGDRITLDMRGRRPEGGEPHHRAASRPSRPTCRRSSWR
jgi:UDP-N-acetylglucosamine 1-carboxyvinyltransferase